ncbi:hypothetical protein [Klebsiella michiganensis]|uniref:hypothetical protein n=1 Tax=Klebsiella michiganensis TaxID=1134687 RepID=UPI000A81B15B|nr:hypothetical protein [Klebsiella michiganensis]
MPFYLTGNPVPSASVLDIRDNSQNLDLALNDITSSFWSDRLGRSRMSWFGLESAFTVKLSDFESRFSTQIVEQETTFDASQADKENRFQAFLDSSGYVFLGDYEDGPFQFSARNQYIRYNNQYYRLNAATDVGFITTGTDATSFANDVTHFVLMDGDTLRQNLGSGDGAKLVGRCAHFTALRATEPDADRQWITLERIVEGGPVINATFTHYAEDTTSADDDYRCIVTAGGKRWHADVSSGAIDLRLAGLLIDGSNFGQCCNKIIRGELLKLSSGNLKYFQIYTNIYVPSSLSPVVKTQYKITEKVNAPTFFGFTSDADVSIQSLLTGNTSFVFRNDFFPELGDYAAVPVNMQGKIFFNTPGMFELVGGGKLISQVSGIEAGNISSGQTVLDAREFKIGRIRVREFRYGLKYNPMDTYICDLGGADLVRNYYNLYSNSDKANSGERITFRDGTIGDGVAANIYWNTPGQNVTFDTVSVDYSPFVLIFGNRGRGNNFTFLPTCHVEGFSSALMLQESMSTAWEFYKNIVVFDCPISAAKGSQSEFASRRKIFFGAYENNNVKILRGIGWAYAESDDQCSLLGYDDPVKDTWNVFVDNRGCRHEPLLTKYEASLNNGLYKFSGSDGVAVTRDAATGLTASLFGGMTAEYSSVYNGLTTLKLTAAAASDTFELRNFDMLLNVDLDDNIWSCISIMMNGITGGNVNYQTKLYHYSSPTFTTTYNGSTYSTVRKYTYLGSRVGPVKDVTALLSVPKTPLTTDKYVGVQSKCRFLLNSVASPIGVSAAIVLSGFVGELHIVLPAFLTEGISRKFM